MIYQNHDFDVQFVKRVVRHCVFVNRIISDGLATDFGLKTSAPKKEKEILDAEVQTEIEVDEHKDEVLGILKKHLIFLMTRMNP